MFLQGFQYVCTKSDVDIYQGTRPGNQVLTVQYLITVKPSEA